MPGHIRLEMPEDNNSVSAWEDVPSDALLGLLSAPKNERLGYTANGYQDFRPKTKSSFARYGMAFPCSAPHQYRSVASFGCSQRPTSQFHPSRSNSSTPATDRRNRTHILQTRAGGVLSGSRPGSAGCDTHHARTCCAMSRESRPGSAGSTRPGSTRPKTVNPVSMPGSPEALVSAGEFGTVADAPREAPGASAGRPTTSRARQRPSSAGPLRRAGTPQHKSDTNLTTKHLRLLEVHLAKRVARNEVSLPHHA